MTNRNDVSPIQKVMFRYVQTCAHLIGGHYSLIRRTLNCEENNWGK